MVDLRRRPWWQREGVFGARREAESQRADKRAGRNGQQSHVELLLTLGLLGTAREHGGCMSGIAAGPPPEAKVGRRPHGHSGDCMKGSEEEPGLHLKVTCEPFQ